MADLLCGANNCNYNKESMCAKGDIMVGGKHASCDKDTCCESFTQRKAGMDSFTSAISHPSRTISIDCEAVKCAYNSNFKCISDHVDIRGAGAGDSIETACGTFTEK